MDFIHKLNSYIIFLFLIVTLNCCKKTYYCNCTFKNTTTTHELPSQTKKNAAKACNAINDSWEDANGSCSISK